MSLVPHKRQYYVIGFAIGLVFISLIHLGSDRNPVGNIIQNIKLVDGHLPPVMHSQVEAKSASSTIQRCTNEQRLQHLNNFCAANPPNNTKDLDDPDLYYRLMLDDTHKIIYCVTPKVGCTTFKTLLKVVSHAPNAKNAYVHNLAQMRQRADLPMMNKIPIEVAKEKLLSPDYVKFMIARHPFDRLLSGYKNKFIDESLGKKLYKVILSKTRGKPENSFSSKERPTWGEFTEYLPEDRKNDDPQSNNIHWRRQVDLCFPCSIKYDYVMRLETIDTDSAPILDILHEDLAKKNQTGLRKMKTSDSGVKPMTEYDKLPADVVEKLRMRYQEDMDAFGYSFSRDGHMSCEINTGGTTCC